MAHPTVQQHFYPTHSGPFTPEDREAMPEPSSRWLDPTVKRAKYQAAGVPACWIADPVARRLTVLELEDGAYVERAVVGSGDEARLQQPYAVTVRL